jgi:hypothetical protein
LTELGEELTDCAMMKKDSALSDEVISSYRKDKKNFGLQSVYDYIPKEPGKNAKVTSRLFQLYLKLTTHK